MTEEFRAEIAELSARIRLLEDRAEIAQLLAGYGVAVDSGDPERAANFWVADGVYDAGLLYAHGAEELREVMDNDLSRDMRARGGVHLTTAPVIRVDGDGATALAYQQTEQWDEASGRFVVTRVSASFSELTRTPAGWRIIRRTNRPFDGSAAARDVAHRAFEAE